MTRNKRYNRELAVLLDSLNSQIVSCKSVMLDAVHLDGYNYEKYEALRDALAHAESISRDLAVESRTIDGNLMPL